MGEWTRILGIDPGSRVTGFGIVESNGPKTRYVASGCIRTEGEALPPRLKTIFEGVRALVTTRGGGVSTGPHRSLNLGVRAGDDPAAVAENRRRLDALLPGPARWLQQVHGSRVVAAHAIEAPPEADASFTDRGRTVCTVMIADCMPVLLCSDDGRRIGAVHCGSATLSRAVFPPPSIAPNGVVIPLS